MHTERFVSRPLGPDDFAALRALHGDPRVMATLSADGRAWPPQITRGFLAAAARHWAAHGHGLCGFFEREGGAFAGYAGLRRMMGVPLNGVELMYAVVAERWGRGYATEMARAVLAAGFAALGLSEVVAFALPANAASRRVLEKLAFVPAGEIVHADLPHLLYRLDARTFARRLAEPSA